MEQGLSAPWRKSTRSGGNGGNCIEVGQSAAAVVVRDTKQGGRGPVLRFAPDEWARFTGTLK